VSIATYDLGDKVRVRGAFTDDQGIPVDPTNIQFDWHGPTSSGSYVYGVDTELVRDSAGNYHVDIDADTSGPCYYRMYSTGIGKAAAESYFIVKASQFG
jgi:hypothetical protein